MPFYFVNWVVILLSCDVLDFVLDFEMIEADEKKLRRLELRNVTCYLKKAQTTPWRGREVGLHRFVIGRPEFGSNSDRTLGNIGDRK